MSGYRNIHREQIESTAIWNVAMSPLLLSAAISRSSGSSTHRHHDNVGGYRIWTASADGLVRSYHVREKRLEEKQELDASALSMTCSHILMGASQELSKPGGALGVLGCTQVALARNYAGEDTAAGDLIVASMEMSGIIRLWLLSEDEDAERVQIDSKEEQPPPVQVRAKFEIEMVRDAVGTTLMICPPRYWTTSAGDVTLAVACLDGSVAQVATGFQTPQQSSLDSSKLKEPTASGTILDRLGSRGSSITTAMTCHPNAPVLAVGRQNGQIDILVSEKNNNSNTHPFRRHRLRLPGTSLGDEASCIRAITYTPDGELLCAGNDSGLLAVWDVGQYRRVPALTHHVVRAHASWILDIVALPDGQRWATCGAERKIHIWRTDQMYQPVHCFDSDETVWTIAVRQVSSSSSSSDDEGLLGSRKPIIRLATGTETGLLQVMSMDS